jgi:hypothetical protein
MYALFSAGDLLAQQDRQLALDELPVLAEVPATVAPAVMPSPWELIPREVITGQGVLGA